jgi:hypothetical protein
VPVADAPPPPLSANRRAFTVLVRNALFQRVEHLARRDFEALGELDGEAGWTAKRWREATEAYFAEFERVGLGPSARNPRLLVIDEQPGRWEVRQIIDDPDETHAWAITAEIDLAASDAEGRAVVHLVDVTGD